MLDDACDVELFAHTWSADALWPIVDQHLPAATRVPVDAGLQRELLARRAVIDYLSARSEAARVRAVYAYVAGRGPLSADLGTALRTRHKLDDVALARVGDAYDAWLARQP